MTQRDQFMRAWMSETHKPHFRYSRSMGLWLCVHRLHVGAGDTPDAALRAWSRESSSPEQTASLHPAERPASG